MTTPCLVVPASSFTRTRSPTLKFITGGHLGGYVGPRPVGRTLTQPWPQQWAYTVNRFLDAIWRHALRGQISTDVSFSLIPGELHLHGGEQVIGNVSAVQVVDAKRGRLLSGSGVMGPITRPERR